MTRPRLVPLALTLLLAACIPHPRGSRPAHRPPAHRPQPPRPAESPQAFRACQVQLRATGIAFEALPDRDFNNGCTATSAVKLVAIGTPVTNLGAVKCPLALAFAKWVSEVVQPAAQDAFGQPVRKLETFGSFACRPVNNQPGNRLSEHAFANAIDVSAFNLADGRRITVKDGWTAPDEPTRRFLRAVHDRACGRFGVVLGPDANAFHHDHFHLDMAPERYCR